MDYETNSKYEVCALAIDFVEGRDWNYKYVEVDFSDEDFSNFKQLIKDSWEKISNMDYWREVLEKTKEG